MSKERLIPKEALSYVKEKGFSANFFYKHISKLKVAGVYRRDLIDKKIERLEEEKWQTSIKELSGMETKVKTGTTISVSKTHKRSKLKGSEEVLAKVTELLH